MAGLIEPRGSQATPPVGSEATPQPPPPTRAPGPFFLLSLNADWLCSHHAQLFVQPLSSQALKEDLLQPKPAIVTCKK